MRKKIVFLAMALLLVAAVVLPACAKEAPAPTDDLLVSLTYIGSEQLDPQQALGTSSPYLNLVYEYLVGSTNEGKTSDQRGLAKEWQASADLKTWTFTLRNGSKFQNGEEVTSEDVKFTFDRLLALGKSEFVAAYTKMIESVQAPDRYTVVINLKEPSSVFPYWVSNLAGCDTGIVPAKYIKEKGDEYFARNPIGSGPYRIIEQKPGSSITLEAVDTHWRIGVPKYKRVVISIVPEETTRIARLKTGEADLIDVSDIMASEVQKAGYYLLNKIGAKNYGVLFITKSAESLKDTPLGDIRVRQALALSIDRQSILDTMYAGQGVLAGTPFVPPVSLGYVDLPVLPFDPERAKELMAEAGYPNGFDLNMLVNRETNMVPSEAIASTWQQHLGVRSTLTLMDYATMSKNLKADKIAGWLYFAPFSLKIIYTQNLRGVFHSEAPNGRADFPELNAMIDRTDAAASLAEYEAGMKEIQEYIYSNYLATGVFTGGIMYAFSDKVENLSWNAAPWDTNLISAVTR